MCSDNLISYAFLNVTKFRFRYSGMGGGGVKGAEIPEDAPDETDAASSIEHGPPSEMGDNERAQRVGQSDADAEP